MTKINPVCISCQVGYKTCITRAEQGKKRKIRNLYLGHPWTVDWCPYKIRGKWFRGLVKAFFHLGRT